MGKGLAIPVEVVITRYKVTDKYSLGHCYIKYSDGIMEYIGASLERGWNDNKKRISCVPIGTYPLNIEYSPRFRKDLWELKGVNGRSECKFHSANYWFQLNGCIALGTKHKDINGDKTPDVTSSRVIMKKFHDKLKNVMRLKVTIKDIT